ncbi:sigma-54-dependent transcriptional regulator [Dethiosulfatarculus sandiegensis]|uniref:Fis family transcriptional regulator n=1 Tax=Dethiosulfatarculus sandiegensis TaxID=1429043 RepID=A0A0D2J7D0_9BACT|nr:sigma-54 dependent transcriptional regulator [Dethiosulfatarculus sandiegensis]KIX14114.1 Fis family transcriptional regulator [Dethiosulfatarculus sandiegensis]
MARLLLVDDDPGSLAVLEVLLSGEGHELVTATDGAQALEALTRGGLDLALVDIGLPDISGLEVLKRAAAISPGTPVIMVTANTSVDSAVESLRSGAADYVAKPVEREELLATVRRLLELGQLRAENLELRQRLRSLGADKAMVTASPAMAQVVRLMEKIAPFDTTVLFTGESGTGKSLAARLIHQASPRGQAPLIKVNCGAIPENLLESELFGYKKGAFTGAARDKAGLFSQAKGGTLFLDEVGELPLGLQVKLLHAVQERTITPLGAGREVEVDVRLIAATNRDLVREVAAGRFREDLYYRLNVFEIAMPPLRKRPEDVVLLAQRFLDQAGVRLGKRLEGLGQDAMAALQAYDWPGNVRELENVVESALVLSEGRRLHLEDLPAKLRGALNSEEGGPGSLKEAVARFERSLVEQAIAVNGGDKEKAAADLGVNLATLYRKLK